MSMSKGSKMVQFINYRVSETAFTKGSKSNKTNLNEETERRTLGLVILRGEEWISTAVEGSPPPDKSRTKSMSASTVPGSGLGQAAGRGIPTAPLVHAQPGLAGPVRDMPGFPPQSGPPQMPPRGPPPPWQYPPGSKPGFAPPGHFQMPPPHYAQRPGMPVLPPPMMCGPPPPSRPGMPPPPGGQVPVYGPPRPGMPPPPNSQQPPQNQQQ
uniref:Uncharacterized protein n=1 Tax=Chenopodium quinoa TaxID=63459 RepID=A0A803LBD6_CHEQI